VNPGTLHAFVAAAGPVAGRAGMGVVFVDAHGRAVRKIGQGLPGVAGRELAAFRGIVYALWNSRRLGSRRVVVHSSDTDVVAQINGHAEVAEELVGPYLEVRALLHAYRAARVEPYARGAGTLLWQDEAQALADAALEQDVDETVEDLPLWSGAMEERSSA
jgi:hypothetical protein